MPKYEEGQVICLSLETLFEHINKKSDENTVYLTNGSIVCSSEESTQEKYYDLFNAVGELVCCDGEECRIDQICEEVFHFVNDNGEEPSSFTLTLEEVGIASFMSPDQK